MAMDTSYLKKRGHTWSVSVTIPRKLRAAAGKKEFVRALGTRDLKEANRLKHSWIAEFKRRIARLEQSEDDPDRQVIESALRFRDLLERHRHTHHQSPSQGEISEHDELLSVMLDRAQEIAEEDPALAERFHAAATGRATFIGDLWAQWLNEIICAPKTKAQHTQAIREFLAWSGARATIEETDRRKAGLYIKQLLGRGLARRTVGRIVSSLSALWIWFGKRGFTEKENPWLGHGLKAKGQAHVRHSLTDEQIIRLLEHRGTPKWHEKLQVLMRLALLTGARIEELCSLKASNTECREDGWWITIEKGKTDAARREVPVHPLGVALVEGLLSRGGEYLIDGLTVGPFGDRSHYASKAYGRFRKAAGVGETGNDFHALRNTVIAAFEAAEVPESTVKLLVGHKRASMTYGLYSRGERVNLRPAMERLRYSPEVERLIGELPLDQTAIRKGTPRTKRTKWRTQQR